MWIVVVLFLNVTPGAYAPMPLRMPKQYSPVSSFQGDDSRVVTADPDNSRSFHMEPYPQASSTQHLNYQGDYQGRP